MFKQAANDYYRRGWLSIPLGLDANGLPKRPLDTGWTSLPCTVASIRTLSWDSARGIGIVLGPVSGNLAVIDIDDVELGQEVYKAFQEGQVQTRIVRTIRKRLHVYFTEEQPSSATRFEVAWHEVKVGIELKAQGTQVAAPPTPGYDLLLDTPPMKVPSIGAAWASIARRISLETALPKGAGYPPPWRSSVQVETRNKSLYIEAHKLREAGMPLDAAVDILLRRFEVAYEQGGMTVEEIRRTIQSAYAKGEVRQFYEHPDDERDFIFGRGTVAGGSGDGTSTPLRGDGAKA